MTICPLSRHAKRLEEITTEYKDINVVYCVERNIDMHSIFELFLEKRIKYKICIT